MAKLSCYQKFYRLDSLDEVVKKFQDTLMVSNKTFAYFVDWEKVKDNVKKYDYEINILNYLVGSNDPKAKLKEILRKNCEILPVLPLIIAVRDSEISVITNPEEPLETLKRFNFEKKTELSDNEINEIILFCERSGILKLFLEFKIKNLKDYLLGVEAGIDTNARKNRSGTAMESLVDPILKGIEGIRVFKQKTFKYLREKENIAIPERLLNRKFDYVIISKNVFFNMEVNYYDGQGSKPQEIVDSYTNRKNELSKEGWNFIWLTDGLGWKQGNHQIRNAFNDMDYVLNIEFARSGILKEILA